MQNYIIIGTKKGGGLKLGVEGRENIPISSQDIFKEKQNSQNRSGWMVKERGGTG